MVNYQNGKIYRIDGGGLTYIGSTTNKYLSTRLALHKSAHKLYLDGTNHYYTSFEILKTDDYKIELIENYPCDSKDELCAREGHYVRQMECVNKNIPGRTQKESKKEWRQNNKVEIDQYNKQYHQNNKKELNQKHKEYYENNKNELKQKHTCECGGKYSYKNKSQHQKSKKHQNYLKDS